MTEATPLVRHFVLEADAMESGEVRAVMAGDIPIALYRQDDRFYATQLYCTHGHVSLAEGFFEDGRIECPLHQGCFEVASGKALCAPVTEDIRTFAVVVSDCRVYVET